MSIIDSMAAATRAASPPRSPSVLEGRIAHDVVSPTDLATVVSDDFGGGLIEQGSAPWPYRGEGVLPKRGDPVWFAEEDGGGIVIVNWQSRDSPEPYPIVPPFGDGDGEIVEGTNPRLVRTGQTPAVEIEIVTSLPIDPYDGQQIIYQGSGAPPNGWHFRYNSQSLSRYRWEAVGQQRESMRNNPGTVGASLTSSDINQYSIFLVNAGYITPPFSGEWDCSFNIMTNMDSNNPGTYVSVSIGGIVRDDVSVIYTGTNTMFEGPGQPVLLAGAFPQIELSNSIEYGLKAAHSDTGPWITYTRSRWGIAPIRVG